LGTFGPIRRHFTASNGSDPLQRNLSALIQVAPGGGDQAAPPG